MLIWKLIWERAQKCTHVHHTNGWHWGKKWAVSLIVSLWKLWTGLNSDVCSGYQQEILIIEMIQLDKHIRLLNSSQLREHSFTCTELRPSLWALSTLWCFHFARTFKGNKGITIVMWHFSWLFLVWIYFIYIYCRIKQYKKYKLHYR